MKKNHKNIKEDRKKLQNKFDGELPEYLNDYFDDKERDFLKQKFTSAIATDGNFWETNEFRIYKSPKVQKLVYEEAERATERLEDEKDVTEVERNALISICEDDLYLFAIRYFPHYLKKPSSPLHTYLYYYLSRNLGKKNRKRGFKHAVAAPRGGSKSSVVSLIFPLWCITYNKKKFMIICSDTAGQAEDFLADIKRELEFNVKLNSDFPHIQGRGATWRQDEIITANDIKILSLGTGSKIRGRRFGIHRPDLLVGDDLESSDMVRSPSTRQFVRYEWFDKDAMHVGGEEGSPIDMLVVGTIIGKDALLNALLNPEEYPEWTSKRFKSVKKFSDSDLWGEWEQLYKNRLDIDRQHTARAFFLVNQKEMLENTEVLWPEGESYYDLMVIRASNKSAFITEKQNESVDSTKILIPFDDLHFKNFTSDPEMQKILNNKRNPWFGALDPSLGKKSNKNDYSCITTIVKDLKTGYILVVGFDIKRREVDDQIMSILRNHQKYRYKLFGVETNAFQLVVSDTLKKRSREQGIYIPVKDILNYQDKKMRVESIVPLLQDGTIIFDNNAYKHNNMYNLAIDQIVTFTGINDEHDDACFVPGTAVTTDDGVKNIEDITTSDYVLSHTGKFCKVEATSKREFSGNLLKLNVVGVENIKCTENHPFLKIDYKNEYMSSIRSFRTNLYGEPSFLKASSLDTKSHLLSTPTICDKVSTIIDMSKFLDRRIIEDDKIYGVFGSGGNTFKNPKSNPIDRFVKVNEEFAFIVGYFLAEGSTNNSHTVEFSGHIKEKKVVDFLKSKFKEFGIEKSYYTVRDNSNGRKITFNSAPFSNLFGTFDSNKKKHLPELFMKLDIKESKALVLGYLFGDGHYPATGVTSCSISRSIAYQIFFLIGKIGLSPKLKFCRRKGRWAGLGITGVIPNDQYNVELDRTNTNKLLSDMPEFIKEIYKDKTVRTKDIKVVRTSVINKGKLIHRKIRDISKEFYAGYVYNLKVGDDNSYVVNGVAVHNCDSLEMAIRMATENKFRMITKQNR